MNGFSVTLRELRLAAGLSQIEVAERLRARGIDITHKAVSKWEVDTVKPSPIIFLELCDIYGVRDPYSVFVGGVRLNARGYARLSEYAGYLSGDPRYVLSRQITIRLFDYPASAGTGNYIDGDEYTEIEVAESDLPPGADYAVRVSGDSMEPLYHDGDVVFVESRESVGVGEVGIFSLNGDTFIKRLGEGALISENAAYAPIPLREGDNLRVFGRVLG